MRPAGESGRDCGYLMLPGQITVFVLLNPTMKLITDLASNAHHHSFALAYSSVPDTCTAATANKLVPVIGIQIPAVDHQLNLCCLTNCAF